MFAEYIKLAMSKATYEILEDDEGFFGSIPGFQGVWANAIFRRLNLRLHNASA